MKLNDIFNRLSEENAQRYLDGLCAIGVRAAGTPGEIAATNFIKNKLEMFGLDTEIQKFGYLHYQDRKSVV